MGMARWYCADFETTSLINLEQDGKVRVWLWSIVGVNDGDTYHGNTIEEFFKQVKKFRTSKIFFHNLRFDGKFIVDYFLSKGMKLGIDFDVLIDGLGNWYEIKWYINSQHTARFWDSLKKYPGTSVKQLGKFVGLPKLECPEFDKYYPIDYQPSEQEIEYCIRDSQVIARALSVSLQQGFRKMTLAGDCFKNGTDRCLKGKFYRDLFPILGDNVHDFCQRSFHGGICYLKPEYEDKELNNVKVFDVNSLYPSVMKYCPLPYGYGSFVEEPEEGKLYIVHFSCEFVVKIDGFPFVQLKGHPHFSSNEFITASNEIVDMYMTNVDFNNFLNNYEVFDLEIYEYLQFDCKVGMLAPHVDYWMGEKKRYEQEGMPFMRYIAKTMMNGFYGKTASRTNRLNVVPMMVDGQVSYSNKVESVSDPVYMPYGTFVTSWARDKLINTALKLWDDFIYCDTDSIHCFERDKYDIDIHPTDLGKWKDETSDKPYEYARYIKQKTYCHARPVEKDGKIFKEVVEIRAAGLNVNSRTGIEFDEFKYGLVVKNANLKMKTVPGGAILCPTDWELKKDISVDEFNEVLKELGIDGRRKD